MNSLPIKIVNKSNSTGLGAFKQGVPVAKGQFRANEQLAIFNGQLKLQDAYVSVIKLWNDGSIKWLHVAGLINLEANEELTLYVKPEPSQLRCETLFVQQHDDELAITLQQDNTCHISTRQPATISLNEYANITLLINEKNVEQACPEHSAYAYLANGHTHSVVKVSQYFEVKIQRHTLKISQEIEIFPSTGAVLCSFNVTNPAPAEHPDGKWDLGDPNSINISELGLAVSLNGGKIAISAPELCDEYTVDTVFQASSGSNAWQNNIHVDRSNKVTLPFRGFQAFNKGKSVEHGSTIRPILVCQNDCEQRLFIEVKDFWQHFPSSMRIEDKQATLSLLGSRLAPAQELQPGEQLTRHFSISPEPILNFIAEPLFDWIQPHQFFPLFSKPQNSNPFSALIDRAIEGSNCFFEKRKWADVYGWRNYGELYADHERGKISHDSSFVSHYNNQYDPIFGMLCQWLCSGNNKWKTLADDLAKHVANIDVYHTALDKPEYAGGMFWHTDHYVQAYTATHRTYSVLQPNDVYQDHAGGGGPGGQHCYTNGLLFHYYLTGSTTSKSALLSICEWIERYYEGDGTLVGTLMAIKNAGNVGLKNVITGAYPLDRGTANYLQALLDRYDLLANSSDLAKCATIIANTVSPDDDINQRNLEDVEQTWFYTVFLQALCRFIFVKEQLAQNDKDYSYAVQSLCHYATWMAENEYVYLEKPDILEFPNDTWTGQDLRKLCILSFARAYLPSNARIDDKLVELTKGIYQRLSLSTEADTTRVLCLLMQNAHYDVYAELPKPMKRVECNITKHRKSSFSVFMLHAIGRFSLRKERSQLAKRFPQLQKWIGQP